MEFIEAVFFVLLKDRHKFHFLQQTLPIDVLHEKHLFLLVWNFGQCLSLSNLASGKGLGFGFNFLGATGVSEAAPFFDGRPTGLAITFQVIVRALAIA